MRIRTLLKTAKVLGVASTAALLANAAFGLPIVLDSAVNPDNGHVYYLLDTSDWTDAEAAAAALGGHLATIRNPAENNWIWDRWGTNQSLWIGYWDPTNNDGGGATHAGDFVWISGETPGYVGGGVKVVEKRRFENPEGFRLR